jgi:hypothetical protein
MSTGTFSGYNGFHVDGEDLNRLANDWAYLADQLASLHVRALAALEDPAAGYQEPELAELCDVVHTAVMSACHAGDALLATLNDDVKRLRGTWERYEGADHHVRTLISGTLRQLDGTHVPRVPEPRLAVASTGDEVLSGDVFERALDDRAGAGERALERAESWVEAGVPYSMDATRDGYRTDCSGFVSMAWGLPESLTTVTLPEVCRPIAASELRAGDVLLNTAPGSAGHVVLFDRWANPQHTAYIGYEQSPGVTKHHVIPYPYFPGHGTFEPYRYVGR